MCKGYSVVWSLWFFVRDLMIGNHSSTSLHVPSSNLNTCLINVQGLYVDVFAFSHYLSPSIIFRLEIIIFNDNSNHS